MNATILQQIMLDIGSDVAEVIPTSTDEAKELLASHKFVVMGGTMRDTQPMPWPWNWHPNAEPAEQ